MTRYPFGMLVVKWVSRLLFSSFKNWMYLLFPFISIVALNYQTSGLFKSINDTVFQVNGNCGYVLKPAILRDHRGEVDVTSYEG